MLIIRDFEIRETAAVLSVYRQGFAGFPWFEPLDDAELVSRWMCDCQRPGWLCCVADVGEVIGAAWADSPTLEALCQERGQKLAEFAAQKLSETAQPQLVWLRNLIVAPDWQGRGVGYALRTELLDRWVVSGRDLVVLTRHRQDNIGIQRLSQRMGFRPTGIRAPSSQKPHLHHEYWYLRKEAVCGRS